ncbi:MAG TPA: TlpA disulfide reductase family protein [Bryobacteraceae bacterium]|nr:TlpA disulfide reductase family protein [Bryobacteraceae bacterium]
MKWLLLVACITAIGASTDTPAAQPPQRSSPKAAPKVSQQEQNDLETALSEAGASPLEYLRAIEKHLQKYPDSPRKNELERAAVRAAMEANDDGRIILHGERVLALEPDDLQILDRVSKALLVTDSRENAERALKYARHYEDLVRRMQNDGGRSSGSADWKNQIDRGIGRALINQSRATGNLGRGEEALGLAQQAFEVWPCADAAREEARWYERLGKPAEAASALADAFSIPDARATDADRARDRGRMGELYRQAHGSETGLGELVLEAYDRNVALIHTRELRLRATDPNAQLTDPMDFTLGSLDGQKLNMSILKSKVVVFDFWATWCGPCRAQHPLYEQVKKRFQDNPDVVFLSVDTDENHAVVKPFLDEVKWGGPVFFEDGLSRALKITSIPTTILTDRHGRIFSRMNGFKPDRFVEMLTARIRDALAN